MFTYHIRFEPVIIVLFCLLFSNIAFAQKKADDIPENIRYLNMEDDQIFIRTIETLPPMITSNPFVKKLRAIGSTKKQPNINNNVTQFSLSTNSFDGLEEHQEMSNELAREILKLSLNFLKKGLDNKNFSDEINKKSKQLYDLLSIDNDNFGLKLIAYGKNAPEVEMIPIAHSTKVFNKSAVLIPFFRHESIIMIGISFNTNNDISTKQETWILSCCERGTTNPKGQKLLLSEIYEYIVNDNKNNVNDLNNPPRKIITSKTCLRVFSEKPNSEEIVKFILSTDFGNNNIYPYTDFATLFNCEVINVSMNENYKELLPILQTGITNEILQERIKIYNRALVGVTATVIAGSN